MTSMFCYVNVQLNFSLHHYNKKGLKKFWICVEKRIRYSKSFLRTLVPDSIISLGETVNPFDLKAYKAIPQFYEWIIRQTNIIIFSRRVVNRVDVAALPALSKI